MLLKDKISELNTEFQKSYYDQDLAFFNQIAPAMLNKIKSLISGFIEKHPVLENNMSDSLEIIEYEYRELKELSKIPSPSSSVKDNYLIAMKQNVSQALWRFHDNILRYEPRMLHEEI